MPGDRSDLIWTKLRPFSASPQIWNPKSGWLFNSNNTPFRATDPASDLKPADGLRPAKLPFAFRISAETQFLSSL